MNSAVSEFKYEHCNRKYWPLSKQYQRELKHWLTQISFARCDLLQKLCLHFIFKCPCWNQIWPNFVFTAGFCTGRWPQNTPRLSLKEYCQLSLWIAWIFTSRDDNWRYFWNDFSIFFPFVNDGVQKAKSEMSDSWKFTTFFWKALSAWPRNFKKCQSSDTCVSIAASLQWSIINLMSIKNYFRFWDHPNHLLRQKSKCSWAIEQSRALVIDRESGQDANLISSPGQSTSTDFHNCQISTKGENGLVHFFWGTSMGQHFLRRRVAGGVDFFKISYMRKTKLWTQILLEPIALFRINC